MSSSMQTLVLCHAAADASVAGELASFLEANCTFATMQEPVVFEADEQLMEAVERARELGSKIGYLAGGRVPVSGGVAARRIFRQFGEPARRIS